MHYSRLSLALLLPFLVAPATAVPAAPAASAAPAAIQAPDLDNAALQLAAGGLVFPLAPAPVPAAVEPFTNGERFQKGLPPAAPKKRGFRALAPRSSPIAPRTGRIRINKVSDNSVIGYVAPSTSITGAVGASGKDSTNSFGVSISAAEGTTQAEISIVSTPNPAYNGYFLGGQSISGDMAASRILLKIFAGVLHTDPGSKPQRLKSTWNSAAFGVESSIFTIGPDGGLTAMWIDFTGANAPSSLCYYQDRDYLTLSPGTPTSNYCPMAVTWTLV